jgi:hypothetical protein
MTGPDRPTPSGDDAVEAMLRAALAGEAGQVRPAGDALARIQARTTQARTTRRHLLGGWRVGPVLATAAVVAVAGGSVAAVLLASGGSGGSSPIGLAGTASPTASTGASTPRPTSSPVAVGPATRSYDAIVGQRHLVEVSEAGVVTPLLDFSGRASDLQVSDGAVYALVDGGGSCGNQVVVADVTTGSVSAVAPSDAGFHITGYAVSTHGGGTATAVTREALIENSCQGAGTEVVAMGAPGPTGHTITQQGNPPEFTGNPAWLPDGQLGAVLRTGNAASVVEFDPFTATSYDDATPTCAAANSPDSLPLSTAASGRTVLAAGQSAGGGITYVCAGNGDSPAFKLPAGHLAKDVSVAASADQAAGAAAAALETDSQGNVWTWDAAGQPQELKAPEGVTAAAW